jgi:hypothetical protein
MSRLRSGSHKMSAFGLPCPTCDIPSIGVRALPGLEPGASYDVSHLATAEMVAALAAGFVS